MDWETLARYDKKSCAKAPKPEELVPSNESEQAEPES